MNYYPKLLELQGVALLMATIIEFLLESILEIVFAIGGVRLALFLLALIFTIYFLATGSYLSAFISGAIGLLVVATFRKSVRVTVDE